MTQEVFWRCPIGAHRERGRVVERRLGGSPSLESDCDELGPFDSLFRLGIALD